MATNTMSRGTSRKAARIPVRKITHEDLSLSLRQGLEDFLTFRGDIVFAGIVYTVIGLAAVVMVGGRNEQDPEQGRNGRDQRKRARSSQPPATLAPLRPHGRE